MCLSVGRALASVQSVGYAVLFPPLAWIRGLWLGDRLILLTRQGLSPASFFTVLVKVREALSDILPREVGEMAGRPEGAASSHHSRIRAPRYELARAPCSSRAPRVPPPLRRGDRKWVLCRFTNRGSRLRRRRWFGSSLAAASCQLTMRTRRLWLLLQDRLDLGYADHDCLAFGRVGACPVRSGGRPPNGTRRRPHELRLGDSRSRGRDRESWDRRGQAIDSLRQ
jgi:hypothetical protein